MTNDCDRDATLLVGRAGAVVVLGSGGVTSLSI